VNGALAAPDALDDEREQLTIEVVGAVEQAAHVTPALDLSLGQAERGFGIAGRCHQPMVAIRDAMGQSCILLDSSVYEERFYVAAPRASGTPEPRRRVPSIRVVTRHNRSVDSVDGPSTG
jgi:hypothetical protein